MCRRGFVISGGKNEDECAGFGPTQPEQSRPAARRIGFARQQTRVQPQGDPNLQNPERQRHVRHVCPWHWQMPRWMKTRFFICLCGGKQTADLGQRGRGRPGQAGADKSILTFTCKWNNLNNHIGTFRAPKIPNLFSIFVQNLVLRPTSNLHQVLPRFTCKLFWPDPGRHSISIVCTVHTQASSLASGLCLLTSTRF